jgi:hypothetical protein
MDGDHDRLPGDEQVLGVGRWAIVAAQADQRDVDLAAGKAREQGVGLVLEALAIFEQLQIADARQVHALLTDPPSETAPGSGTTSQTVTPMKGD